MYLGCVTPPQLLYTLTFWLLLRQSVKDNFRKKKSIAAPLTEVTTGGKQIWSPIQILGLWAQSLNEPRSQKTLTFA